MTYDEMQEIWNTQGHQLRAADCDKALTTFAVENRRQRRKQLGMLVWAFFQLLLLTTVLVLRFAREPGLMADIEWGVVAMMCLPWAYAFFLLKQYRASTLPPAGSTSPSIVQALENTVLTTRAASSRIKWLMVLYLALAPTLAVSMWQLHESGKMNGSEIASMAGLFGGVLVIAAGTSYVKFRRAQARHNHVATLLQQFNS